VCVCVCVCVCVMKKEQKSFKLYVLACLVFIFSCEVVRGMRKIVKTYVECCWYNVVFPGILTFRRSIKFFLRSPERLSTEEMEDEVYLPLVVGQNKTKLRTIKNLNKEVDLRNRILAVLV